MASKKKYVVAKGYSFVVGGIIYIEGEEISEEAFSDKKNFARLVAQKKIIAVTEDDKATDEGKSSEDGKTADETKGKQDK